jgi:hypothetical protein
VSTPNNAPTPAAVSDTPPAPEVAAAPEAAARLRGVKFSVSGASTIQATCADAFGSGVASALVRNVPVGRCTVQATLDGVSTTGHVVVDSPRLYRCTVEGEELKCQ